MNIHSTSVLVPSLAILLVSCGGPGGGARPGANKKDIGLDSVGGMAAEPSAHPTPRPKVLSAIARLRNTDIERYDFAELAHFADTSAPNGSARIAMGDVAARKHINGGWRSGFSPVIREDEGIRYVEANKKRTRFFFSQTKGGFAKIVVKMRAVRRSNKVSVFLNGQSLGKGELGPKWEDFAFDVPSSLTREGENQLMMRFSRDTRADKRAQAAHVAYVAIVRGSEVPTSLPKAAVAERITLDGVPHSALEAKQPTTWTYRLQLDERAPKLGLYVGASEAGGKVTVTARAEGDPAAKTVHQQQVSGETAGHWQEAEVSLKGFEGKVVEVNFEVDTPGVAISPFLFSLAKPEPPHKPVAQDVHAKNVLVYLIDTMRYDKYTVNNPKSSVTTPNLDAFAKDATIFDAAYDAENWTKPSTASILTGLYPWTHGTKMDSSKLPRSAKMISEHLREQGLRTGAFIANGYVSTAFGFGKGWDRYTNYIREEKVTDAERLVNDTFKFIDKQGDKRWFAYVHTIDPHVPYSAPGKWKYKHWRSQNKGKYRGKLRAQNTGNQLAEIKKGTLKMGPNDKLYLESLYDSEVEYNDTEFGRLIAGLKKRGVYDNTIIVVLADHGEEFWDHGSVGHGHSLYDELVHTGLFIRYPNMFPRGERIDTVVSTVDLVPTLTETLGVKPMDAAEGSSIRSVLDHTIQRPRVAISDFLYRFKSIRVGRYHWQTSGQDDGKLFDVRTDRAEKHRLKGSVVAAAYVRSHFGLFMGARDKTKWWLEGSDVAHESEVHQADAAEIDPELKQQLEAMGYVEGATGDDSAAEDKKKMEREDN